jgi:hypothetical protein
MRDGRYKQCQLDIRDLVNRRYHLEGEQSTTRNFGGEIVDGNLDKFLIIDVETGD